MNAVFLAIVLIAFAVAAVRQVLWVPAGPEAASPMELLTTGAIEAAGGAVTLAIGLVGVMALFLGLMKVAEEGGLLVIIAKTVRPLMVRLFPEVPAEHPAMGAMILNISANALGLGNATTINPSGGALAGNPMMAAGLSRIGEAARRIWDGSADRAVAHATSGPCLQQNLVCVMEGN